MVELGERIKAIAVELTRVRSVVGTEGEIIIAEKIYEHFKQLEYFQRNPDNLKLLTARGDQLGRQSVCAIVQGKKESPNTLVCLGHIDTVGVNDYAELQDYASDPDALKQKLPSVKFSEDTLAEITSDDWIVGRGILDMKTGVAALIVMVEEFVRQVECMEGNLVFIGVPDEEGNSAGMLSVVQDLAELARQNGWKYMGAIDTDYTTTRYPGDDNRYVYIGTTGKLLPCFYVYGEETHVGEAFNGVDANLLAAEVIQQMDLNVDLCDIADGEVALPPVCLHQRDLKTEYSVQTANAVNLYFNFATHISVPDEVLTLCKERAQAAFRNVVAKLNNEYKKFCQLSQMPFHKLPWEVNVLTYDELYQNVKAEMGDEIDNIIGRLTERLQQEQMDDREFSLAVVQEVHNHYSDKNSKIIVYFAPPYYPHIFVRDEDARSRTLLTAVNDAVAETRKKYHYHIITRKFYPYISDLSYCSMPADESIGKMTSNMPAWSKKYTLPVKEIQDISMPVVNIGPFGKDAHKLSERVCSSYSFDAMPLILYKTLEKLLINRA